MLSLCPPHHSHSFSFSLSNKSLKNKKDFTDHSKIELTCPVVIHNCHLTLTAVANYSCVTDKTVGQKRFPQVTWNFIPSVSYSREYFKIQVNEDNIFRLREYFLNKVIHKWYFNNLQIIFYYYNNTSHTKSQIVEQTTKLKIHRLQAQSPNFSA